MQHQQQLAATVTLHVRTPENLFMVTVTGEPCSASKHQRFANYMYKPRSAQLIHKLASDCRHQTLRVSILITMVSVTWGIALALYTQLVSAGDPLATVSWRTGNDKVDAIIEALTAEEK
ncbi:hypothetical protein L916_00457, partial [Phytophthora nicotianae]